MLVRCEFSYLGWPLSNSAIVNSIELIELNFISVLNRSMYLDSHSFSGQIFPASDQSFKQEVVMIDVGDDKRELTVIGATQHHAMCTPDIASLVLSTE
jgi:hypothetical protein